MAIDVTGWRLSITLMDSGNNKTKREYGIKTNSAQTEAEQYAVAFVEAQQIAGGLGTLTNAKIIKWELARIAEEDDVSTPTGDFNVEENALLSVRLLGAGDKRATMLIPAPKNGIFVATSGPNRNNVNVANTDLLAFIQNFQGTQNGTISDGEQVAVLVEGKRIHRNSRKG